jgi:signal transduction histidine kinase
LRRSGYNCREDHYFPIRSADQLTSSIEGTGLGLAIARQIVEYHGGKIWATRTLGKKSIFTFTLPLGGQGAQKA